MEHRQNLNRTIFHDWGSAIFRLAAERICATVPVFGRILLPWRHNLSFQISYEDIEIEGNLEPNAKFSLQLHTRPGGLFLFRFLGNDFAICIVHMYFCQTHKSWSVHMVHKKSKKIVKTFLAAVEFFDSAESPRGCCGGLSNVIMALWGNLKFDFFAPTDTPELRLANKIFLIRRHTRHRRRERYRNRTRPEKVEENQTFAKC